MEAIFTVFQTKRVEKSNKIEEKLTRQAPMATTCFNILGWQMKE